VSAGLAVDLAEVRRNLQVESDELGTLSATLGVVYDDLEVVRSEGTSSLAAHAIEITARVHCSRGTPFVLGSINPSRLLVLTMGTASI